MPSNTTASPKQFAPTTKPSSHPGSSPSPCNGRGIRHQRTLPHCPWMNSRIERAWSTFKQVLRVCQIPDDISLQATLNLLREVYNQRRPHQSLSGYTPNEAWKILIKKKAKAQATRSNATTIVGSDKVAGMIGQALSAITLGFTARNGENIAVFGLLRRRPGGRQVVQERSSGVKSGLLQPPEGSRDTLRTADKTPRSLSHQK